MPAASVNREDILYCCLSDFNTMSDYSNLVNVIWFYHAKKCDENDCKYCSFLSGLDSIYSDLQLTGSNEINRLRFYCILRHKIFAAARICIHGLANLEKRNSNSVTYCQFGTKKKKTCFFPT